MKNLLRQKLTGWSKPDYQKEKNHPASGERTIMMIEKVKLSMEMLSLIHI